jgi:hypothetical protein
MNGWGYQRPALEGVELKGPCRETLAPVLCVHPATPVRAVSSCDIRIQSERPFDVLLVYGI